MPISSGTILRLQTSLASKINEKICPNKVNYSTASRMCFEHFPSPTHPEIIWNPGISIFKYYSTLAYEAPPPVYLALESIYCFIFLAFFSHINNISRNEIKIGRKKEKLRGRKSQEY